MTAYDWKYLPKGQVKHALSTVLSDTITAECGVYTFGWWYGTGSQTEYERVAALPPCQRCVAKVGVPR